MNEDNLRIVMDEARLRLESTEKDYDTALSKASLLLGFVITITLGVSAFFYQIALSPEMVFMLPFLVIFATLAVISLKHFLDVMRPEGFGVRGYNPVHLMQNRTVKKPTTQILCWIIEEYGYKVAKNLPIVDRKNDAMAKGVTSFLWAVGILVAGAVVSKLLAVALSVIIAWWFPIVFIFG